MSQTRPFLSLVELLRVRAAEQPDRPGFVYAEDGEQSPRVLTYADLDRRARAIAASLQERVAPGDRALLLHPPGTEFIEAIFGCLYAGVIAVPVAPPHPSTLDSGIHRLVAITREIEPSVLLTTSEFNVFAEGLLAATPHAADLRNVPRQVGSEILDTAAGSWREHAPSSDDLAYLQYTSGSTTAPKGVMIAHGNVLSNLAAINRCNGLGPNDALASWLPHFHDMGLVGGIMEPLFGGFPAYLMSPMAFLRKPGSWLRMIAKNGVTCSGAPNFAYDLCVRKTSPEERAALDLRSWKIAWNSAEPVRRKVMERFIEAFASAGFRRDGFVPCYGMAEATLLVAATPRRTDMRSCRVDADRLQQGVAEPASTDTAAREFVSCGAPVDGKVAIVNPQTFERCTEGQVGEIWIGGASVSRGYWRRGPESEQTFGATIKGEPGTFLRSGDLGFVHEGELHIAGRLKDLIIIRGRNHYPQDIEATVERSHPAIRPGCSAAFSTGDKEGVESVVIMAEVGARAPCDLTEVLKSVRRAVAEEHEIQVSQVLFVNAGSIPKTSSGKIARHLCRAAVLSESVKA